MRKSEPSQGEKVVKNPLNAFVHGRSAVVLFRKLNSPEERNNTFSLQNSVLFQSQFGIHSLKEKQQLQEKEKKKEIMDGRFQWPFQLLCFHQNNGLLYRNSSETHPRR